MAARANTPSGKPYTIAELAQIAESSLIWDPTQPLRRYVGAVRQLVQESKVYQKEGDYDRSFVMAIRVHKLTTELLPNRHPEWHSLPPAAKQQIYKDAQHINAQISELKRILYTRSEETAGGLRSSPAPSSVSKARNPSPAVAPPTAAPGSVPALTLRNTVQPSSNSMSDPGPSYQPLTFAPPSKQGRAARLKRKLIGGKKPASSAVATPPSSGALVEPGTAVDVDDEKIKEEWTLIDEKEKEKELMTSAPVTAYKPSGNIAAGREQWGSGRAGSNGKGSLPMPGEDDEEGGDPIGLPPPTNTLLSDGTSAYSQPAQRWPTYPHHVPPTPPIPYTPPSGSLRPPGWDQAIYQNHKGTLQQAPQTWPSYSVPQHPAPPRGPGGGAGLQRTPSRLTTSHQQQQGFTPSHNLLSAHYFPPVQPWAPSQSLDPLPWMQQLALQPQQSPSYLGPHQPLHPQSQSPHSPPSVFQHPSNLAPQYPSSAPAKPPLPVAPQHSPQQSYLYPSHGHSATPIPAGQVYSVPPLARPVPPALPPLPTPSAPLPASSLVRTASLAALPVLKRRWASETKGDAVSGIDRFDKILEEELSLTEGGQPLRNLILPIELMRAFVLLSRENTDRGIETCGLLMGTLSHNTFTITHLLVPRQEGTTDTCSTTHEEEQFAFQDARDLMTLGWIHTHPTQTCFMSSLDLHTHASYQVMLAEAIAIVCSPKHDPAFGVFRLTDPPGLETIVRCDESGMFHPHPDLPIYTDTDHGHVQLRSDLKFECHDLRFKSQSKK